MRISFTDILVTDGNKRSREAGITDCYHVLLTPENSVFHRTCNLITLHLLLP